MNCKTHILAIFFLLCSLKFSFGGDVPLQVSAKVEKDKVTVGEIIKYVLTVSADSKTEAELPQAAEQLGNFQVKDSGRKNFGIFGKKKYVQWYNIDSFTLGKDNIPSLAIKYRKKGSEKWEEAKSQEISVEVISALKGLDSPEIRDIKPPVSLKSKFVKFLFIAIIIIVIIILIILLRFKNRINLNAIPKQPAHIIAYEQLECLKNKDYIRQGRIKEYYSELSGIIRHYLENRFLLAAPEMTTEEFLFYTRDSSEIAKEHRELLKEFLHYCDLVKFARHIPLGADMENAFLSAKGFVDQTKEEEIKDDLR